jgi:SHS2 domain-containing protein
MTEMRTSGFEELEHTADWSLHAWAPDLAGLFEQAARGMYALMDLRPEMPARIEREVAFSAADAETLLVMFLSELLYFASEENLAFDQFELSVQPGQLEARLMGASSLGLHKEIKAVTYHLLEIAATGHGLEVTLVFDV